MGQKNCSSQWESACEAGKMPREFMVDFETFGKDPLTCGIMSVSVMEFFQMDAVGESCEKILLAVSMESNYEKGLDMSSSQQWWNDPLRAEAWSWYFNAEKVELDAMADRIIGFFSAVAEDNGEFRIWSRGEFDWIILKRIFAEWAGRELPYYIWRDARTFIRELHISEDRLLTGTGFYLHRPSDDCRHCIRCIQTACRALAEVGFYGLPQIAAVTDEENHLRMKKGGIGHGV